MSIFSPRSSLTTMRTRAPRAPTHAPTGSTLLSFDHTAIFVRWPGSRAHALISTTPSAISGTSSSNSRLMRPGWVATHDDLRALRGLADLDDVRLDPRARLGPLVGHLLGLRQQRLDPSEVEQRVAAVVLLDDAGDDVAFAARVLLVLLLAVDLAEALRHHLLRGLRGDAAEVGRRDVDLVAVGLAVLVDLLREHAELERVGVDGDPRVLVRVARRLYADSSASASALEEGVDGDAPLGGEHLQRFHHVEIAHWSVFASLVGLACRASAAGAPLEHRAGPLDVVVAEGALVRP